MVTASSLAAAAWGTLECLDAIEAHEGNWRDVDEALVEALGATVRFEGDEVSVAALLAGKRVVRLRAAGRCKTRGWAGKVVEEQT